MKAKMTGLLALGFMLTEEGRITAIRNERLGLRFDLEAIKKNGLPRVNAEVMAAEGFEIGWSCSKCLGSGEISVPCDLGADGYRDEKCPDCEGGVKWEAKY